MTSDVNYKKIISLNVEINKKYTPVFADYENGKVTIHKDQLISMTSKSTHLPKGIRQLREDRTIVSSDGLLLKDVVLNSLSSAAKFVRGYSDAGLQWRENDNFMTDYFEQIKKRKKGGD